MTANATPRNTWFTRPIRRLLPACLLALGSVLLLMPSMAVAQVNPEIANCSELKDEATVTQADLCAAHVGCRFVLNVQKTCARAKGYLERLQAAIGEGTRTLFGTRKEVTPDAVFTATLGDESRGAARTLGGDTAVQAQAQEIGAQVRDVWHNSELTGKSSKGSDWIYYGQTRDGAWHGTGTVIYSSGEIQRGEFKDNQRNGAFDTLLPNGSRHVGKTDGSTTEGLWVTPSGVKEKGKDWKDGTFIGTRTEADGSSFTGRIEKGKRVEGTAFRADGTVSEKGRYENGQLSVGVQRDAAGNTTSVDLPAARAAAAREAAEAQAQRKREEAARQQQQFQARLQTANPGELYALADELSAQGDAGRAREAQRALTSRFPDHPLALTAARQMAGLPANTAPAAASASATPARATGSSTASSSSSSASSVCARNAEKINQVLNASGHKSYAAYGAGFHMKAKRMSMQVLTPCAAQDPQAARLLAQLQQSLSEDENYCARNNGRGCLEWGVQGYEAQNQAWFAVLQRETQAALANPSGYAAGSGGGAAPARTGGAALSAQECRAREQAVMNTRIPANASITASQETVMFMTRTAIEMHDAGCPGVSAAERRQYQESFAAAQRACDQVQSGGRRCTPNNHFGPGATPGSGLRSPDPVFPQIPVPKMSRTP
ncbi:hypothetical protein PGB34_07875 [Xenophilus arseniciresistens]|uniref:MORN repeat protein n=1 Tax=Xenophilus arseniciresistens TaxID=1283306 RepID=A0AAE3N5I7_9BURK|nr:hypothetical protein [Xenophilus arseniciresistens]MDA7416280.1 hypothetical protein [Xenophilus arseniciresistens]